MPSPQTVKPRRIGHSRPILFREAILRMKNRFPKKAQKGMSRKIWRDMIRKGARAAARKSKLADGHTAYGAEQMAK